jgi:glycerol kinase
MQFQADLIGRRVIRPEMAETTAAGAAILAGMSAGLWSGRKMMSRLRSPAQTFKPSMKLRERDTLVALWHEAVARTLSQ